MSSEAPTARRLSPAELDERCDAVHQHLVEAGLDVLEARHDLLDEIRRQAPLLSAADEARLLSRVTDRVLGLGPLASLLDDEAVSDVLVNGPGAVWTERDGALVETGVEVTAVELERIIERLTAPSGRRADRRRPVVDLHLADGVRAHVVLPPVAVDGPYLALRRFRTRRFQLTDFAPAPVADVLTRAVDDRGNVLVVGGTGSGKTSLLGALAGLLDPRVRVVTVEDAAELRLPGRHVVRLETRPATNEGLGAIELDDLVRASLRLRPDRLIIGEVRGAEAHDLLDALNTGHPGSWTTCHANDPTDALDRLETMALRARAGLAAADVRRRIHAAFDLVVHVRRGERGRRFVASVNELARRPADVPTLRQLTTHDRVIGERTRPS